jgi:hypothetical protein
MPLGTTKDLTSHFAIPPGSSCPHVGSSSPEGIAVIALIAPNDLVVSQALKIYSQNNVLESCAFELNMTAGSIETVFRGHNATLIIDITCNGTAEGTFSILDLGAMMTRDRFFQLKSVHGQFIADEARLMSTIESKRSRIIFVGIEIPSLVKVRNTSNAIIDHTALALRLSGLIANVVKSLAKTARSEIG